jgi:hypothetical protein
VTISLSQTILYVTFEYWVANEQHLRDIANELEYELTVYLWPSYFPAFAHGQNLAYDACIMHKVRARRGHTTDSAPQWIQIAAPFNIIRCIVMHYLSRLMEAHGLIPPGGLDAVG